MDIALSFLWFMAGAVMTMILRKIVYFQESKKIVVSILTNYILLMKAFREQLIFALNKKKEWLRESGLEDDYVNQQIEKDEAFLKSWEITATSILVSSLPEKYKSFLKPTGKENK